MAQETSIDYKGKCFWIKEVFIELLSHYICSRFEKNGLHVYNQNLLRIYDNCDGNRSGVCVGMVGILFDDYIQNSIDKDTLISVLEQTKIDLAELGDEISITALNEFEDNKADDYFKSPWAFPVKTQSLIGTIDLIIDLLNGSLQHDNREVHYQGFPIIPHAIIV